METIVTNQRQNAYLECQVQDFDLNIYDPNTDGIAIKKMSDYKGKRLVLFFYPADFTFVCPTELKDLGTISADLDATNANVLVVSTDTVFSHKRWIETEHLLTNFKTPMVSDRVGEITKYFGIFNEKSGNAERGTFVISPDGVLKAIEVVTEPIGRSSHELLRKVKALEFVRANPGLACPASWNTGEKTLQPSIKIAGHVAEQLN